MAVNRASDLLKDKSNVNPVGNRASEATAEDFQELGALLDQYADRIDIIYDEDYRDNFLGFFASLAVLSAAFSSPPEGSFGVILDTNDNVVEVYRYTSGSYQAVLGGNSVQFYDSFSDLPATGETDVIYMTKDTKKLYAWYNSQFNDLASAPAIAVDQNLSSTSTNPVENKAVAILQKKTNKYSTDISQITLKSLNYDHIICQGDLTISFDHNMPDDFNILITVEVGKTVTLNYTGSGTINETSISGKTVLLSKFQGDDVFQVTSFAAATAIIDLSTHSVTELNDVSSAGSGSIITAGERTLLNVGKHRTTTYSSGINTTTAKALSYQHIVCDADLTIELDDTFSNNFNLLITVKSGKKVTVNTSSSTINVSKLSGGAYFLTKIQGTNNFHIEVVRRDFQILSHTGNTFDINTKAGKIYYESFSATSPYSSNPKQQATINLNIGADGSWAVINSNTSSEPSIVNNTDSRPVRYLAGGNQWSEDGLSSSTIDIVIQVLPFEVQVSYRLIAT